MNDELFLKLEYGKFYKVDLHGKSLAEAQSELIYLLGSLDISYKSILVVHGFHLGTAIRDFVRNKFSSNDIVEKVNVDAGQTLLRLRR